MKQQPPSSQPPQSPFPGRPGLKPDPVEQEAAEALRGGAGGGLITPVLSVVAIVAVVVIVWQFKAAPALAWHDDVNTAIEAAETEGKPILMYFTADWCPPCQWFKSNVLKEDEIEGILRSDYILLKIDLSDRNSPNNIIAQKYEVRGVPSLIVYDTRGNEIDRLEGAAPADIFGPWLAQCASKAQK